MTEIIRANCPICQGALQHVEEISVKRQINRITADGVLQIYGTTETIYGSNQNERLECSTCLITLPVPKRVKYI